MKMGKNMNTFILWFKGYDWKLDFLSCNESPGVIVQSMHYFLFFLLSQILPHDISLFFESVPPSMKWLDNHKYAESGKAATHAEEHLVQSGIWLQKIQPLT